MADKQNALKVGNASEFCLKPTIYILFGTTVGFFLNCHDSLYKKKLLTPPLKIALV